MKKQQIKNLIQRHLLETLSFEDNVFGNLTKKSLGFSGYVVENVLTNCLLSDVNRYAKENNLLFTPCSESRFGGHFKSELEVYEFFPNPEFYGDIMEHTMNVSDSFNRISGRNDKILNSINEQLVSESADTIISCEDVNNNTIIPILENLKRKRETEMFDPSLFTKFAKVIVRDATNKNVNLNELKQEEVNQVEVILVKFLTEKTSSNIKSFDYDDQSLLKNYNKLFLSKNY